MIPECMLQNIAQPHRKPSEGEYASRRNTYTPPLSGYTEASSAQIRAPASVSAPAKAHTRTTPATERISPVITEGCTKIDAPMIVPTTIAVARTGPMERRRSLMAYLHLHGSPRRRRTALAALRLFPDPRQHRAARRRAAAPLDGVRGRAPVLERKCHRRGVQRAADADREAAAGARLGGQGVHDPVLLRPLRHVHLRARRLRFPAHRGTEAAVRVWAQRSHGAHRVARAGPGLGRGGADREPRLLLPS